VAQWKTTTWRSGICVPLVFFLNVHAKEVHVP
jgi:hypothetical protein